MRPLWQKYIEQKAERPHHKYRYLSGQSKVRGRPARCQSPSPGQVELWMWEICLPPQSYMVSPNTAS